MFFSGHSFCPKLSPFIFPPSSFPFAAVHHKRTATIGNKRLLCKDNGNKRFSISMNGKERVAQPLVHVDLLQTKGFWEKWKRQVTGGFFAIFFNSLMLVTKHWSRFWLAVPISICFPIQSVFPTRSIPLLATIDPKLSNPDGREQTLAPS